MKRSFLIILAVLGGVVVAAYGLFVVLTPPTLPAQVLYGNGHLEGTDVQVSSEIPGRVIESTVVEGRKVSAGDMLVRLDDADLRIKLAQAQAELAAVESVVSQIRAELDAAQHHARTAADDLQRYQDLNNRGAASKQRVEQAQNASTAATANVQAMEAKLREANARRDATNGAILLIELQIEKSVVRAPLGGTITIKTVDTGEVVNPGQTLAVVVDLTRIELKVFVTEANLGKIRVGEPARVRVTAFQDRYFAATVARVDQEAQFTPREIHMPEERARMVFGVTLLVENSDGSLKPGMPADAWILWDNGVSWPDTLFVPR